MYISIKNSKGFPKEDISEISRFLLSDDFQYHLSKDVLDKDDEYTRKIIHISDHLYMIRHSEFSFNAEIDELHIISSERYGLIDLYHVGIDANRNSILYWIVKCNAKHVISTDIGLIAKNTDSITDTPKMLGRFDHIWFASTKNSSVLAIDKGSSHLVT
jgi:hypothetical protein